MNYNEFIKLQKGDIVVCTDDAYKQFTKGKYYEVSGINDCGPTNSHNSIGIVVDDAGSHNGWTIEHFEVISAISQIITASQIAARTGMSFPVATDEPELLEAKPRSRADVIWELLKMAAKQ